MLLKPRLVSFKCKPQLCSYHTRHKEMSIGWVFVLFWFCDCCALSDFINLKAEDNEEKNYEELGIVTIKGRWTLGHEYMGTGKWEKVLHVGVQAIWTGISISPSAHQPHWHCSVLTAKCTQQVSSSSPLRSWDGDPKTNISGLVCHVPDGRDWLPLWNAPKYCPAMLLSSQFEPNFSEKSPTSFFFLILRDFFPFQRAKFQVIHKLRHLGNTFIGISGHFLWHNTLCYKYWNTS